MLLPAGRWATCPGRTGGNAFSCQMAPGEEVLRNATIRAGAVGGASRGSRKKTKESFTPRYITPGGAGGLFKTQV